MGTVLDLAREAGVEVPADTVEGLAEWIAEHANGESLEKYLQVFALTTAVMQTREQLRRVAREFVEDLVADGVVYGEIRWAPEQHLAGGLSLDEAVEAVQAGLDEAVEAADAAGHVIRVGQLVTAMRHADRAQEIAELAVRHREAGVVGFDIAGAGPGSRPPASPTPSRGWPPTTCPSPCTRARATAWTPSARPSWTAAPCVWATACAWPRTSRWSTAVWTRTASSWTS